MQSEVVGDVAPTLESQLTGLQQLWAQTLGDPRICIAVLDGPVDLTHPSLREAALTVIDLDEVTDSAAVSFSDHGTHVTSIIFGSHDGPVKGIAPNCRGLIIPIFRYAADGSLQPCSQERLAKAIRAAVRFGANVINISAGQFSSRGEASPVLRAAIEACGEDVLIVSAAGNDGCDCLHVPGALPSVLAVGSMNAAGRPLPFSNWGQAYREQGVLAPGEKILGAAGDGGVKVQSGTSFSTPIVSGVAGLLLSLQQKLGIVPSSKSIRRAILETTHGCDPQTETQCERVLAGRLSISGSVSVVTQGATTMQNATNSPNPVNAGVMPTAENAPLAQPTVESVEASACCGGCAGESKQYVYAIGELQYDFPSVLRERSVQQNIAPIAAVSRHVPNARNSIDFLRHLFGFKEVKITDMNIGDIDMIEVKSSIYHLSIVKPEADFELRYGPEATTTKIPKETVSARAIETALTNLPVNATWGEVTVTEHPRLDGSDATREYVIEFTGETGPAKTLTVMGSGANLPTIRPIGRLKLTISDGEMTEDDLDSRVGFVGVGVSVGKIVRPSVLESSNSLVVQHILPIDATTKTQIVYVETDQVDANSRTLSLEAGHYYIPKAYQVTNVHRPNMHDAGAVIWKLTRGHMEVYGIVPDGNFAEAAYEELAEFHLNQLGITKEGLNYYYYVKGGRHMEWKFGWDPCFGKAASSFADAISYNIEHLHTTAVPSLIQEKSERVAIPGVLQGEVQLITGMLLPAIKPDMRGTAEWSQARMLDELLTAVLQTTGDPVPESEERRIRDMIRSVLERLDDLIRNSGVSPEHRALNHAATHLFGALGEVAGELLPAEREKATSYELDDIVVKRSEIGYAGSDCWDVEVSFFNPTNVQESRVVVCQTIDVNDTIPALTDKPRKFRRR